MNFTSRYQLINSGLIKMLRCIISVSFACFSAQSFVHIKQVHLHRNHISSPVSHVYYVDSQTGNDGYTGYSPAAAWKTLDKINATVFAPGDHILLKCGQTWMGQLHPRGAGNQQRPNLIGSYGLGKKPLIAGQGVANGTVYLYNQPYWEIHNLEITNYSMAEEGGMSLTEWENRNLTNFELPELPPQVVNHNTPRYGIYVAAQDTGTISHVQLINLDVHGVNGYINQKDELSKNNGGIFFEITGKRTPTCFSDVLIDSCSIHDVDRTGILLCKSSWDVRTLTATTNWTPSEHIIIRRCYFSHTGANALIVRVAQQPLVEHNTFDHCAIKASGNACFSFNCDSAVWQYNECRYTKANTEDVDAGGMDADYRSKNTIIQYNYLHDNDYGMLITGGPNSFNDHTVLRYNIIEHDGSYAHPKHGKTVIRVNGSATQTHIYNNIFYLNDRQTDIKIVSHETWTASPLNTLYQNNIFYNLSTNATYDLGISTGNTFDTNLYYGNMATHTPADVAAITLDPQLVQPGSGNTKGYRLKKGSPAISAGQPISGNGNYDFYGKRLPVDARPNIGVDGKTTQ